MAVVDYINEKDRLPPALNYAFQAHEYQALPNKGGLREQPVKLLSHMRIAYNVWRAVSDYLAAPKSAEWAQKNRSQWQIAAEALSLAEKSKSKQE